MSTVKSKKLQVGTDATSSNNFTIYQPATPDGTLRIGVGNADSPTEVGQFNANGYKPAQPVTASAYMTADVDFTSATWTKVPYNATQWDTTNDFDTTNHRYIPSVAGYYLVRQNMSVLDNLNSGTLYYYTRFYKNGGIYRDGASIRASDTTTIRGDAVFHSTTLMYFNGTTDYVESYIYYESTTTPTLDSGSHRASLEAILISQA